LGQLYAGLGYDKNNYAGAGNNGFNIGSIYGVGPVYGFIGGVDLGGAPSVEIVRAVGGFKSDALEIGLLVQEAKYTQNSDFKDLTWQLSAGFGVGENLKLKAQYTNTDANNADTSADQATIGADYKLGAQTKIYAYATRGEADNDRVGAITGVGAEHRF
jgi:predicted porin